MTIKTSSPAAKNATSTPRHNLKLIGLSSRLNGNSLPEAVIVVALMGIIAVVATFGVHHISRESKAKDLRQDVASLNRAVGVYLSSGGSLADPLGENPPAGLTIEQAVVQKLKTIADEVQAEEINGFRGSAIDLRMTPVIHTEEDGKPSDPLVVWSQEALKFHIDESATEGVEKFKYDDDLAGVATQGEVRPPPMRLAKEDDWVWDYDANTIEVGSGPSYIGTTSGYGGPGGFNPGDPSQLKLAEPVYSEPGGLYNLNDFDKTVTMSNPNPPGTSQIVYNVNGGPWRIYQGESIAIPLDTSVQAIAVSIDPDYWIDSDMAGEHYDGEPIQLELEIETPQESYSYAQAGGDLLGSGSAPLPSAPDPAVVRIANIEDYPEWLVEEAQLKAKWGRNIAIVDEYSFADYEGDTAISGTINSGLESGLWSSVLNTAHPDFEVDISIDHWTPNGLVVRAMGKSGIGSKYVIQSPVEEKELSINQVQLRTPVASIEGGTYTTNEVLQFRRNHEFGDTPKGARIFVSTDGADPMNTDGTPRTGAVQITDLLEEEGGLEGDGFGDGVATFGSDGEARTITARVLPPAGFEGWFAPSEPINLTFQPYVPETWHGYIGGDFGQNTVTGAANIRQHVANGDPDGAFDVGAGLDGTAYVVEIQDDGNAIVGGSFNSYAGTTRNGIVRITPEGDVDPSFDPGVGFNGPVRAIAVQPDGKILCGGAFTQFAGVSRKGLARLNDDGTLDTSFAPEDLDIAGGDVVNAIAITKGAVPGGTPPPDPGLVGGHFDLDTSSYIASIGSGSTDGHVHEYDDKYDTAGADFFNLRDSKLDNITDNISDPNAKFKIIVANADLSPGARLVINDDYDAVDPSTFTNLRDYDNIPIENLPVYSLSGVAGTTKLEKFALYFETYAIPNGRLVPTNTGDVRKNIPGLNGEWRNGAVTVQVVAVNPDGTDGFGTDLSRTAGGVHGVATSGLYWEGVAFWHWHGVSYHENPDYLPNLAMGQEMIEFNADGSTDHLFSGFTEGWFSNPTGDANLVTSLEPGESSNEFWWGDPVSGFSTGNYLGFHGAEFHDVPTDVTFLLGMLEYYNSSTYLGTNATGVEFDLEVSIINPSIDVPFDFDFSLLSTPNYSYQTADQNADYVWIGDLNTDFSAWLEGFEFGLELQFGELTENGFATIDTFHVHEGATAQGFLFGQLFLKQVEPFMIVVGGEFESYGSHTAKNLVRIMADGAYDSEFDTEKGAEGRVNDLVVQPDGKIVIVGDFSKYDGRGRKRVARVNTDGSRDNGFNVGKGANKEVYTVALYEDGKIFFGGEFNNFNKKMRKGVARLHANGKLDSSYDPGTGNAIPSWRIHTSSIAADEKVVVGGLLTANNALSRSAFKRLDFDGTIDETFNPPDLPQGSIIYGVGTRPGGEALIVGDFDYSEVIEDLNDIAKINTGTGALDYSFDPGSGTNEGASVKAIDVLSDGSVIMGGSFTSMDGEMHDRIAKLSTSGVVDSTFVASIAKTEVGAGALEIDFEDFGNFDLKHGQIIDDLFEADYGLTISANNAKKRHPDIAVLFDTNERHTADADLESPWSGGNIAHRLPDGLLTDFGHALIIGENDWDEDGDGYIDSPDDEAYGGSITFSLDRSDIIGFQATFIDFEQTDEYSIYLTQDEIDSAIVDFDQFVDPNSLWYDPYIALGDNFVNILPTIWADDTGLDYFSEITVEFPGSGALDQLFFITDENWTDDGAGNTPALVSCLAIDGQDRILVGGDFNLVNGTTRHNFVRLNPNGTLDHSFTVGAGFNGPVFSVELDDIGNILVGGAFSTYKGAPAPGIVRLFPDGQRDLSFQTPGGATVTDIRSLPGGRVAYCGNFSSPTNGVAIVNKFGVPRPAFSPGEGASGAVSLDLLPDGRLVVGGDFSSFNGTAVPGLACLLPNGAVDVTFHAGLGAGPNGDVMEVRVLPGGKILVCGAFDQFSNNPLDGVAKVNFDGTIDGSFGSSGIDAGRIAATR